MSPVLLATIVALLVLTTSAALARRRTTTLRRRHDDHHRARRRELEIDHDRDPGFHSWRVDELTSEHEEKRAEAERASRAADVYAHLAEEQEARAAELAEESADAAARAGLEDFRVRHLEADAGLPAAPDQ